MLVYLPEDEPARSVVGRALAARLATLARLEEGRGRAARRRDQRRRRCRIIRSRRTSSTPASARRRWASRCADGLRPWLRRVPPKRTGYLGLPRDRPSAEADMPEGDTIFRAARTLQRALAGKPVVRSSPMLPALDRVHEIARAGRTIDRVQHGRQTPPDALLRRPRAADAHAHERQLAHLPAAASAGSVRAATCASSSRPTTSKRSASASRSPS